MFLGEGRAAFLEFLRNLTPQIVFLTLSLISWAKVDWQHFQPNWQGFKNLALFVTCTGVFFGSLVANTTRFLETAVSSNEQFEIELQRIRAKELGLRRAGFALLSAAWRLNRRALAEIILVLCFGYTGLYVAVSMTAQAAVTAIRSLQ